MGQTGSCYPSSTSDNIFPNVSLIFAGPANRKTFNIDDPVEIKLITKLRYLSVSVVNINLHTVLSHMLSSLCTSIIVISQQNVHVFLLIVIS